MDKKLFIETITAIKEQLEHDRNCHDAFSIILPNDYVSGYDYSKVLNMLIKLLKIEFNDNSEWIEYFIWDLEFGDKFEMGMVTENYGKDIIDLSSIDKLYDFLKKNNGR